MAAEVDQESCTGCGECVEACPLDAIELKDGVTVEIRRPVKPRGYEVVRREVKDGVAVVDAETCGDCGACVDVCPVKAITVE